MLAVRNIVVVTGVFAICGALIVLLLSDQTSRCSPEFGAFTCLPRPLPVLPSGGS
jgi:hypothetical protein